MMGLQNLITMLKQKASHYPEQSSVLAARETKQRLAAAVDLCPLQSSAPGRNLATGDDEFGCKHQLIARSWFLALLG